MLDSTLAQPLPNQWEPCGGKHAKANTRHHSQRAGYPWCCRFANPVALNGAAGWVFVNSPTDIQHICATNTRNYQERYLPDIYK